MAKKITDVKKDESTLKKREYVKQTDIPKLTLSEALRLANSLYEDFAGKQAAPHQLAIAVDISPTSSNWRDICGASIAYGLTSGGYNSESISLTELGKKIVAPTEEEQDTFARVEAALKPSTLRKFYEKYNHAKFPQEKIAKNVLSEMGVPFDYLDKTLEILIRNGEFVRIIHQTKTGPFVAIDTPSPLVQNESKIETEHRSKDVNTLKSSTSTQDMAPESTMLKQKVSGEDFQKNQRVFITHGKNKVIVDQLKDLLTFGKFIPIVAEEHETPSKPVPDKVLDDMRSCFAGIIHVASEDELLDKEGNTRHKINENVLIEIGAAMALYKRNFILLVQKGIHLPSNLQGLYQCFYEGDKLEYEATMKLLKAFNEFK